MGSLLWVLYEAGLGLALLIAGPFLLARRGSHYLPTLAGRLGAGAGSAQGGSLWLHAVSVGEVGVAATLVRALPAGLPLLVTTVTPTGQALARRLFAGRAEVAYLPFDLRPAVRRFWRRFQPAALVLIEGDYWPLLLREARRLGLPVAVVNGRVGDHSYRRLRRLRRWGRLVGLLFGSVERFGLQTALDRARLEALGVDPARLTVTGNLKFETAEPPARPALAAEFDRLCGGRPLLVAGSTMAGEEEAVLAAFAAAGGGRRAMLLLAPRHPERCDEVERLLRQQGLSLIRRSQMRLAGGPGTAAPDVVLLDSLGELAGLYRSAAAAFVGGTLVDTGGHNPLEPARYAIAIAAGPSMHNFREMADHFDRAGAWRRVASAAALGQAWKDWLADPDAARRQGERAAALLQENRGALAHTLEVLAPLLARFGNFAAAGGGAPAADGGGVTAADGDVASAAGGGGGAEAADIAPATARGIAPAAAADPLPAAR